MNEKEPLYRFLIRVADEVTKASVKVENEGDVRIYSLRSLVPGDFAPLVMLPQIDTFINRILHKKYDAVLATPFLSGLIALHLRRYMKEVPIIYEDVDRFFDFFRNPIKRLLAKAVEYQAILASDQVIAVSPHLYLEDLHLRGNRPTHLIPNGIEYSRFRRSAAEVKKRERNAIVYVGAVEWWSGLDIAIEALSIALKEIPDIKLYIVGDYMNSYGIYLANLVKRLDLKSKIIFLGRRSYDFVVNFLPRCRLGLLTFPRSKVTEWAFPYKVLEYSAAGLPVVMTNVTVLAKMVEKYKAGRVHDVEDIEGIASSIVEFLSNERTWSEYSNNAVMLASLFDVAKLARKEVEAILSTGVN